MRLGTETGSINNWLDSRAVIGEPKPCVGMGAGLVAAWDAIPAEDRRDLTKAFAKGFNEEVNK